MAKPKRSTRGNLTVLPSGNIRVRVYAGIDPLTGKRRYLTETHSPDEAEIALTRLQNQVDEKRHPRSKVTVGQVIEQWLEVAEHETSTRERIEDLVRLYIAPTFGDMEAGKLDAELLERFYARLRKCKDLCNGRSRKDHKCRPLAANTVRKIHFIFRPALDKAVRWRYLGVNEAAFAEPPAFESGEPDPPSAGEVARLLNEASSDPQWCLLLWMTMITGSRRGEMCGLRWTHLDLDRGIAWVKSSVSQTREGLRDKDTKSGKGRRVSLDDYTVGLLRAHREWVLGNCAQLGIELAADGYVFSNAPDGSTSLLPRSVSQRYRRLAQRLKLQSTRLHSLRHYNATELITAGVDLRTVAGRLGHGNGATTLRVYAAWVAAADKQAATTIADVTPRPDPTKREPRSPYEKIAAELRAQINSGQLAPGMELPTAAELSILHHVSVGTASRAVALLKTEGLVAASRGRRAVVNR